MPLVQFDSLPDDARVWVFAAAAPIDDVDEKRLLAAADAFLLQWKAHGNPLTCGRDWRDERFLAVGVDQRTEGASGCSIDGLFRTLQGLERAIGTSLVGGGLVFFRDGLGLVHSLSRDAFEKLGVTGGVSAATPVFDTTVTRAGDYRARFERKAGESWHATLLSLG
ncbi:MAG: ABC transporter ATPase [Gemmatimonadales bacterium]